MGKMHLNNSGLSTSKFLDSAGRYETKATYKTSYFGCLSNSSKKNDAVLNADSFLFEGLAPPSKLLDISPPLLHKSVSCFDPIM